MCREQNAKSTKHWDSPKSHILCITTHILQGQIVRQDIVHDDKYPKWRNIQHFQWVKKVKIGNKQVRKERKRIAWLLIYKINPSKVQWIYYSLSLARKRICKFPACEWGQKTVTMTKMAEDQAYKRMNERMRKNIKQKEHSEEILLTSFFKHASYQCSDSKRFH